MENNLNPGDKITVTVSDLFHLWQEACNGFSAGVEAGMGLKDVKVDAVPMNVRFLTIVNSLKSKSDENQDKQKDI
jgi:hypothetical protein